MIKLPLRVVVSVIRFLYKYVFRVIREVRYCGLTFERGFRSFESGFTYSTDLILDTLREFLRDARHSRKFRYSVDVGCGVGVLVTCFSKEGLTDYSVGVDVDLENLLLARLNYLRNLRRIAALIDFVACWGTSCVRESSLELGVINPPYLPCRRNESDWISGLICCGEKCELLAGLLADLVSTLKKGGFLMVTSSSLTTPHTPLYLLLKLGVKVRLVGKKKTPLTDTVFVFMGTKV